MRFKFRAYDPNTDMMHSNIGIGQLHLYDFDGDNITEQEGLVIMQWTGLQDKNGVDIYEGDVVKGYWWEKGKKHRIVGTVTYVMNAFLVRGVKQYMGLDKELNPVYEVIGNIYENPELIGRTANDSTEILSESEAE